MTDLKIAFEILGVGEGATREEIEKRYNLIARQYRYNKLEESDGKNSEINMDKVTKAYKLLIDYEINKVPDAESIAQERKKINVIMKKAGIDWKKVNNFFYYYKIHMIASIVAIIVVFFTVRSFVTQVRPDFNLLFLGQFAYEQTDTAVAKIKAEIPGVKAPSIQIISIFSDSDVQSYTQAMVVLGAGDVDVVIVDKENFNTYAKNGAFASLDELVGQLGIDKEKNKDYIVKLEESNEKHLYGIDVSGSVFLSSLEIAGKDKIAVIKSNSKHLNIDTKFIKLLLQ